MKKELVYYNEKNDRLVLLCNRYEIWYSDDLFWRVLSVRSNHQRLIKSIFEIKEHLNATGYEFVGDL